MDRIPTRTESGGASAQAPAVVQLSRVSKTFGTVKAVDGGTDAPANYWLVTSELNGVIPRFAP